MAVIPTGVRPEVLHPPPVDEGSGEQPDGNGDGHVERLTDPDGPFPCNSRAEYAAAGVASLLDIEKIQKLIEVMVANDLTEVSLRDGDVEVNLRRPNRLVDPAGGGETAMPVMAPSGNNPTASILPPAAVTEEVESAEFVEIKAPMVGTFYAAPDPDSPPFVHPGTKIVPSTVVCMLEAMKVFSEIKAEVAGTIERVLVKNAEPVEYGQPLFLVRMG
jgi:acetyl-CoA carboxylase biotin carboxyl carrier protein